MGVAGSTDRQHNTQSQDEEFEHLIFDIEEVECKMTDIEEQNQSESPSHRSGDTAGAVMAVVMRDAEGRSLRGSFLNSPKNYQFNNGATRMSDMSVMSSINLTNQTPNMHGHQQ